MMLRNAKQAPRIGPLEPPFEPEVQATLELLGAPIALFRVLARQPDRASAIHGWGSYYLSQRTSLTLRQRELVIHRTTARCGAEYEWGVHAAFFAARAGLGADELTSTVGGGPDDPCWSDDDRAVLRAVDALHERSDLDDAQWADLVRAAGEEGAVDVVLVAGWYHAISFLVRSLRLELEPGSPRFAELGEESL